MKRAIEVILVVLLAVGLITALFTNGFSEEPFPESTEMSIKALNLYVDSVENTKETENFKLSVTTTVQLNKIDCNSSILSSIFKTIVNHRLGKIDPETEDYLFENGVLKGDETISVDNIVQPVNSEISKNLYSGVKSSYLYDEKGAKGVYFVIGQEKMTVKDTVVTYRNIGEYDLHKEYPEVKALAPNHSNFVDITSAIPRIKALFQQSNEHVHDTEQYNAFVPNYGDNGKMTQIESGYCFLGNSNITAIIDNEKRLSSVIINCPVGAEVNIRFGDSVFKAVVEFNISQSYFFEYED